MDYGSRWSGLVGRAQTLERGRSVFRKPEDLPKPEVLPQPGEESAMQKLLTVLSWGLLFVMVTLQSLRHRRAWWPAVIVLGYAVASAGPNAVARPPRSGPRRPPSSCATSRISPEWAPWPWP